MLDGTKSSLYNVGKDVPFCDNFYGTKERHALLKQARKTPTISSAFLIICLHFYL